jgi:predicted nucleic acid-binding protein
LRRLLRVVPRRYSFPRDPKDEPYLDLALETRVPYLVTRDRDLLELMTDHGFRTSYPWLSTLDPAAFIRQLKPAKS